MTDTKKVKILVEMMHGMGDTVCALPMLQTIRANYPDSEITVLTKFASATQILEASRIPLNQILSLDIYKDLKKSAYFLWKLRQKQFDYGISSCITPVKKAKMIMAFVHPKHVVGIQNQGVYYDDLQDKYHFVDANLLSIQDFCHLSKEKIYPRLYPDEETRAKFLSTLTEQCQEYGHKKRIGICIGDADYSLKNRWLRTGKVHTRSWGIENMAALIKLLLKRDDVQIVLIGGKAEENLLPILQKEDLLKNKKINNFVGKTSLKKSIALVSLCDMVFGVDTGMQHIAAAAGTATVSVFGPTNPLTHGAYAENAHFITAQERCEYQYCYGTDRYVNCPNQRKCLKTISPEYVYKMIEKVL
ncbi:glycosyltransferase family 9 protein [Mitsuokella sp.]|uniref:glycosyltransferase family 9 protein n=1 Tax=Mitsuokella sp. TaxID=2049034 RepID=UPI003D7DCBA1